MTPSPLAALLTPPGKAAVATLGVAGARAWQVLRPLFTPRKATLPDVPEVGQHWLGRFGAELADEVILAVKQLTPTPLVEVHCHGGAAVVRYLLDLLHRHGCTPCGWQAFLDADGDSLRAAAATALAHAPTARTAAILLDQYHGALARALDRIVEAMAAGDRETVATLLAELTAWSAVGRHLIEPFRVVIAGPPNVGKSSLVNALAGYTRAVVAPTPGTTRDVVTTAAAFDGWPVELTDTAGMREGAETLEALGIEQARAAVERADLCVWLVDASTVPEWPAMSSDRVRIVVNKTDLAPAWDLDGIPEAPRVSATMGAGVAELGAAIARWLVPQAPPPGAAVPFTEAQRATIELMTTAR